MTTPGMASRAIPRTSAATRRSGAGRRPRRPSRAAGRAGRDRVRRCAGGIAGDARHDADDETGQNERDRVRQPEGTDHDRHERREGEEPAPAGRGYGRSRRRRRTSRASSATSPDGLGLPDVDALEDARARAAMLTSDAPPWVTNGSGMPVIGMIPRTIPTLTIELEQDHRGDAGREQRPERIARAPAGDEDPPEQQRRTARTRPSRR